VHIAERFRAAYESRALRLRLKRERAERAAWRREQAAVLRSPAQAALLQWECEV
jgi:hypothetical protein